MPTNATRRHRPPEPPRLALSIQVDDDAGALPADRAQLRRWVRGALGRDAVLTLRFVGRAEGRALNAQFRGRDYATNVLTFAYDESPAPGEPLSADIVVCMPVVLDEARAQGKSARDHLAHLVVHGTLHAQGHDHEEEDAAREMEALETAILGRFRIADPYR
jgi:probable rRNA maturation factor